MPCSPPQSMVVCACLCFEMVYDVAFVSLPIRISVNDISLYIQHPMLALSTNIQEFLARNQYPMRLHPSTDSTLHPILILVAGYAQTRSCESCLITNVRYQLGLSNPSMLSYTFSSSAHGISLGKAGFPAIALTRLTFSTFRYGYLRNKARALARAFCAAEKSFFCRSSKFESSMRKATAWRR